MKYIKIIFDCLLEKEMYLYDNVIRNYVGDLIKVSV